MRKKIFVIPKLVNFDMNKFEEEYKKNTDQKKKIIEDLEKAIAEEESKNKVEANNKTSNDTKNESDEPNNESGDNSE